MPCPAPFLELVSDYNVHALIFQSDFKKNWERGYSIAIRLVPRPRLAIHGGNKENIVYAHVISGSPLFKIMCNQHCIFNIVFNSFCLL